MEYISCPYCGKPIKKDAKFCKFCGKQIPRCPECGIILSRNTSFCPNDGTRIPEDILLLIPNTDTERKADTPPFVQSERKTVSEYPGKKKNSIWLLTAVLAVTTVVIAGCLFLFRDRSVKPVSKQKEEMKDFVYKPSEDEIVASDDCIYIRNLINVILNDNISMEERNELASSVDGFLVSNVSGFLNMVDISIPGADSEKLKAMAEQLEESDKVQYASLCIPVSIDEEAFPVSYNSELWNGDKDLGKEGNPGGADWWAEAIKAYTAWDFSSYCNPIVVGIIDNGFECTHEDLQRDQTSVITMLNNNSIDKESDDPEHGTHVAGLIAAQDNSIGIQGITPGSDIVCIDQTSSGKSLNSPSFIFESFEKIIEYADEKGNPVVINNSWGVSRKINDYIYSWFHDETEQKAARYEYDVYTSTCAALLTDTLITYSPVDFLIVQSSGNGYALTEIGFDTECNGWFRGIDQNIVAGCDSIKHTYPDIKNHILVVAAVENRTEKGVYQLTSWSNYGHLVDIAAPGNKVFSTVLNNQYSYAAGTSMAAPIVSGAAAYIWSLKRNLEAAEVKDILLSVSGRAHGTSKMDLHKDYPMLDLGSAAVSIMMGVTECKVVDSKTGKPISNVTCRRANTVSDSSVFTDELSTDEDGLLYSSAIGHTEYIFEKDGYESKNIVFDVSPGEEKDLGIIQLTAVKKTKKTDKKTEETDKSGNGGTNEDTSRTDEEPGHDEGSAIIPAEETPIPEPKATPEPTPKPTPEPESTPEPTPEPTADPEPEIPTDNYGWDNNPFNHEYWVIFTEGYRSNRVEATAVDINDPAGEYSIIWNKSLDLNRNLSLRYHQYYLDENNLWIEIGTYHKFTDWATNIIASNLDIYSNSGTKISEKIQYKDLDWSILEIYR